MMKEYVPKIEGSIFGRQNACGNLIQQRLKLLVVVLVDQRDSQCGIGGEPFGAVQTRETSPHNDDMRRYGSAMCGIAH
jgi:hypothetical protein